MPYRSLLGLSTGSDRALRLRFFGHSEEAQKLSDRRAYGNRLGDGVVVFGVLRSSVYRPKPLSVRI